MLARLNMHGLRSFVALVDKSRPEPTFVYTERPVVGFFAGLSAEQKARALAHRGDENHGDTEFKKVRD